MPWNKHMKRRRLQPAAARRPAPRRLRPAAFTLTELVVAMGITILLIMLAGVVFQSTGEAVSRGIQLGDTIASHRAFQQQVQADFDQQVGPVQNATFLAGEPAGFLVITQNKVERAAAMPEASSVRGETSVRDLRDDGLLFVRHADGLQGVSPRDKTSFAPAGPDSGLLANYALVWYGHVDRTESTGTLVASPNMSLANTTSQASPNYVGWNWILGRQAKLLAESGAPSIHANTALHDAPVSGYGTPGDPGYPVPLAVMISGLADVANQPLRTITGGGGGTGVLEVLAATGSDAAYRTAALNYTYVPQRLRTNPLPADTDFAAWQVAQMHPYFMPNVSDFVVEFAADTTYADTNGDFVDDNPAVDRDASGNIRWYGLARDWNVDGDTTDPEDTQLPTFTGNVITATGSYAYGPSVATFAANLNADRAWVWRHDRPESWPYLIRIRYRLHDTDGRLRSSDPLTGRPVAGRWFEVIVPVNRGEQRQAP